jgi:hypothetical protein
MIYIYIYMKYIYELYMTCIWNIYDICMIYVWYIYIWYIYTYVYIYDMYIYIFMNYIYMIYEISYIYLLTYLSIHRSIYLSSLSPTNYLQPSCPTSHIISYTQPMPAARGPGLPGTYRSRWSLKCAPAPEAGCHMMVCNEPVYISLWGCNGKCNEPYDMAHPWNYTSQNYIEI